LPAWNAIAEAFAPFIRGLLKPSVVRALGGREDAEQTIHLALIRAVGKARPGPHIANEITNDAWDSLKCLIRRSIAQATLTVELEEDPRAEEAMQEIHAEDPLAKLDAAVPSIIDAQTRDMLVLKYVKGLNAHEIAEIYELSHSAVRKELSRALVRLQGEAKGPPKRRK
jgi:RNA polymerase sigma factor (sigma-70 family)